jgi:RNA-directed DNA polymerase
VEGTPQGAGISSLLLANIFLHYVLDLWVEQWKRRHATGQVRLVRYADDHLLLFRRRQDAETMTAALAERLAKFGLHLHEDKTRLIEFGRFAEENRRRKGRARGRRCSTSWAPRIAAARPQTDAFSSARRPKGSG